MKTWQPRFDENSRQWWLLDAKNATLGRLASQVAVLLRGKDQVTFAPHLDVGGFVVIVNSDGVQLTGEKWQQKKYYRHSRYFGSLKEKTAQRMLEQDSRQIILQAVEGMLPKNKLGRKLIKKLKVYPDAEHPHEAQKPQSVPVLRKGK